MLAELQGSIGNDVLVGLMQAAAAIALCAVVVALCAWQTVHVEREAAISMLRGLVQMILVGVVLAVLLHGSLLIGSVILFMMTIAAAVTASRRLKGMNGALLMCFWSIVAGAGTIIAVMLATRSLQPEISILVPVGSMIIANAMNACAQAIERFRAEIVAHTGHIEAALSLGAEPAVTVAPYLQSAVYASLLPRLDMMKSLGLVWIPGVMAGMVVSGASPVYAGIYQFIIVAMILAASGITSLVATALMRSRAFSPAAQLLLRPADPATSGRPTA
ncbi:putative iron export permease protein FetB [Bradyrhizobium ivorense]|uniref:Iron export permease protein FetB n=1 Tax=Bradyrhizobium ivorense TaxID=2511166 RepID=A0A508TPX3_9BRAD|nr:ABC transporter permease [Bradyrhizobium ivorense]VIO76393.1 putative iron export permease protein FetB [Bradyrhizobium ivorense]